MKITFYKAASGKDLKSKIVVLAMSEEFAKKATCNEGMNCPMTIAKKQFDFKGENGEMCTVSAPTGTGLSAVIFAGLGKEKEIDDNSMQEFGGKIVQYLNSNKIKEADIFINSEFDDNGKIDYSGISKVKNIGVMYANVAFGARLQDYSFSKYYTGEKLKNKTPKLANINISCSDDKAAKEAFKELDVLADAICFTRDLVSEPGNILNPKSYAEICKNELNPLGIKLEILGEKEMEKLGMNSLLSVGQASTHESKLVIMHWNGAKDKKAAPVAFVGKGVTFDTGGISLKPSKSMEDMKTDMGGSAVVVGLMKALATRKAKVNAIGVIGIVENTISGNASRPGDVVKSMSGQTIEIINTDAEGRLVLADALYYTQTKFKPKMMIDLATLTGAVIVALADLYAGLFSNNDELAKELVAASEETGEKLWRMPLSEIGKEYDKMVDSQTADVQNVGNGNGAGSITAAQFLQRFIDGNKKWAHLDIAGVAWKGKGDALAKKGATGFGVKLLNQLVKDKYEEK